MPASLEAGMTDFKPQSTRPEGRTPDDSMASDTSPAQEKLRWRVALAALYWNAIKSERLSVTDFGFNGSFAKLALPEFKTL